MAKHKLAIALALVVFLVLTGGGVASALWSTGARVTSTVEVASLADACINPTSVVNASFEEPVHTGTINQTPDGLVPGWDSLPDHNIEMWIDGMHESVPAPVGRQFVELNGHEAGTLSQVISTTPGQTLQWSLMHRGRWGVDTMEVRIGAAGAPVHQATISDGQTWKRYSGVYVVPAGQDATELSFRAVSTSSGDQSVGNFLDDVSFGSGPCLAASSTVKNVTLPGSQYRVGDIVEYVTTVANTGSSPSFNTVLTNVIPVTLEYVPGSLRIGAATPTDAADNDHAEAVNGALTARLGVGVSGVAGGSLAQGTNTTFTFRAKVLPGSGGSTVHYTPKVGYVNNLAPAWAQFATAPDVSFAVLLGADIAVSGAVAPLTMNPGTSTPATWTITAVNNGPLPAGAGKITVTLPAGHTTGSISATGATCSGSNATRTCTFGSLAVGASITITVTRTIASPTVDLTVTAEAALNGSPLDSAPANNTASVVLAVKDTQVPSIPGTPTMTSNTGSQVAMQWNASTDNVGVHGYDVYRDAALIGSVAGTVRTFTDFTVAPWSNYAYTVKARDAAGNVSSASGALPVSTAPGGLDTTSGYQFSQTSSIFKYCAVASGTNVNLDAGITFLGGCSGTPWRFAPTGAGYVKIEVHGTPSSVWQVEGNSVRIRATATSTTQEWLVTTSGSGLRFESRSQPGQCLQRDGSLVSLSDCTNGTSQRWIVS